MKGLLTLALYICLLSTLNAQDKGAMVEYHNNFYGTILENLDNTKAQSSLKFKATSSPLNAPQSYKEFSSVWCGEPISQGRTGTCWCYSTSSFYESEIFRLTKKQIKLSELHTVYYEYISKAEEFIRTKGKSFLGEGSETNAVQRQMKRYGLVPFDAYDGNPMKTKYPDHAKLFKTFSTLLEKYKSNDQWDERLIMGQVKEVLNKFLGVPPTAFTFEGKEMTPMTFMKEVAKINPDDYVDFMSLMEQKYWLKTEYEVPDNYWKSRAYNNVPLDVFMDIIKNALQEGYSMSIGGDVSGPGYLPEKDLAFIPSFDIPSKYINESSRQLRFSNGATTDDHAIHLIGYKKGENGKGWFLVKDSGSSARNGENQGYFFYSEDYVKLKMMTFTIHKDAVKDVLKKMRQYE